MEEITAEEVIQAILDGKFDNLETNRIIKAIKTRREMKIMAKIATIEEGDYAYFNEKANPAYLNGIEVKVVKVNRKRVKVDFADDPFAKGYSGAKGVSVPVEMITIQD